MQPLYGMLTVLQTGTGWAAAGIFVIALVICCLVMMFMMRGRDKSKDKNEMGQVRKNDEGVDSSHSPKR